MARNGVSKSKFDRLPKRVQNKGQKKKSNKEQTKKSDYWNLKKSKKNDVEKEAIDNLERLSENFDYVKAKSFAEMPLSEATLKGLQVAQMKTPTKIQAQSIGFGIKKMDILGAAKTGSGKTLAFLIPVFERLHRLQWSSFDGLGCLIITPTRELAYQIFQNIKSIGKHHNFPTALIIGGTDVKFESSRIDICNIIIGTPGRLLQHMDENPRFDCTNLQILVLDEADRILDMGFAPTMNAIIANLPETRQTLLFSATQTKSVKDLARLSLKDPKYVSVHENAKYSTPDSLKQIYFVCELHEKLNLLWSFIRNHLGSKIIVFMATCKQVKFMFALFSRMRPGMSLLELDGSMSQLKRTGVYTNFCEQTKAILFTTDVAARGLDIPAVHWVCHFDCPEDVDMYIHRSGRTARLKKSGDSVLFLLSSEEKAMVAKLIDRKIPIDRVDINTNSLVNIQAKCEILLTQDVTLKERACRSFVAYMKNIYLMKDKEVFQLDKLHADSFARSLGLSAAPRLRFLEKLQKNNKQKGPQNLSQPDLSKRQSAYSFGTIDSDESDDEIMMKRKPQEHVEKMLQQTPAAVEVNKPRKKLKPVTKAAIAKKLLHKKIVPNTRIVFDDEGEPIDKFQAQGSVSAIKSSTDLLDQSWSFARAKEMMAEEDRMDRMVYRQLVKNKHRERKLKAKKQMQVDDMGQDDDESDYQPDLDFLPDPDKIYGKDSDEQSAESSADESSAPKRMKLSPKESLNVKARLKKSEASEENDDNVLDTGLSLEDDENLALHILQSHR